MVEYILSLLYAISTLALPIGIAAGITLVATLILMAMAKGLWINKPGFKLLNAFYDLSGFLLVRTASVWLKSILPIIYICMYTSLDSIHYVFLALIMVVASLDVRKIGRTIGNFVWNAILLAGVFFTNILYKYMQTGFEAEIFVIIYIGCGIFIALYDFFIMMCDFSSISSARTPEPEREEKRLKRDLARAKRRKARNGEDEEEEKEKDDNITENGYETEAIPTATSTESEGEKK